VEYFNASSTALLPSAASSIAIQYLVLLGKRFFFALK
jgi:hypothetical protein